MKAIKLLWAWPLFCAGCMTAQLERQTLNQSATLADIRFRQVMDNLAQLAACPDKLPAYAAVGEGAQNVTELYNYNAQSLWQKATFKGFSSETGGLIYGQVIAPSWTLDPVFDPDQLTALQAAFHWAVFGPPPPDSKAKKVLDLFQVSRDLAKLPPGWLCAGKLADGPHHALYKSHCKGTWVWVTAEGMAGLSAFTLIIQDIATVDPSKLNYLPPSLDVKVTFGKDDNTTGKKAPVLENKSVNQDVRAWVVRNDEGNYNKIKAIVATVNDLGLEGPNTILTVDPAIIVQTSQAPNAEGTQPPPPPALPESTSPSFLNMRRSANQAAVR